MSHEVLIALGTAAAMLLIYLMFQLWFWVIAFLLAIAASVFAMIASIIHFQILWALGFMGLAIILIGIMAAVVGAWPKKQQG